MASVESIKCMSFVPLSNCLWPKEQLLAIASKLDSLNPPFGFNYRDVTDEQLSELQEHCFKAIIEMCEKGDQDAVQKIEKVAKGLKDSSGNTIFLKFICEGKEAKAPEAIKTQLKLAYTLSDEKYEYSLHQAVKNGKSPKFLEVIKDQGYCTSLQKDPKGRMPIHLAAKNNRFEAIGSLLPMTSTNTLPMACLTYYSKKQKMDLSPMSLAVMKGHISSVDALATIEDVLADVRVGEEQMTLLHLAIYKNQFKMLEHLLTKHFGSTQRLISVTNSLGYTPLILAAQLGDIAALVLLIHKGANLKSYDLKGRTVVHHAVLGKHEALLRILAKYGADFTAMDAEGLPPSQLIKEDKKFTNFLHNLTVSKEYLGPKFSGNFTLHPPENLIFNGGGFKEITFF